MLRDPGAEADGLAAPDSTIGLRLAPSVSCVGQRLTLGLGGKKMRISLTRLLAGTVAVASAACASSGRYNSSSAGGNIDVGASAGERLDAREAQLLQSMSDADILGHLIT